ncbi:T9SS type A sorting domain-containing protein [Gelidibacter japonicus]|jgi:PKD repeat protein|uniref:T9SS type A sorting domain-containing protein n=1 Tax=Gelidibacter japonicus TaxID=1962232 RepID=UPI002AFDCF01|nr:T9SS type A sorting domain-containing protein [Gelidibacter japonicus]
MKKHYDFFATLFAILFFNLHSHGQKLIPISNFQKGTVETKSITINKELCGTDFIHDQKMKEDAQYRAGHRRTLESMQKVSMQRGVQANGVLQIPIVVHVMHKGEPVGIGTNISDADVKRGIRYLNNFWRKTEGSLGDGNGVDMNIEFVLAVQDEDGNCTDGILRVDMSSVTEYVNNGVNINNSDGIEDYTAGGGVNSLKEYSIWDPNKYYNVWIVDEIDNKNCYNAGSESYTAGYAYFASAHGRPYDGTVVLSCSYLDEFSNTFAHELGHAFNLPHTFNGDDSTGDGKGDQCGDDGIFDTPSHMRISSIDPPIYCDNNDSNECDASFDQITNPDTGFRRNTGTHQDHMSNYMNYTSCRSEFTGGQRAVVNSALNDIRASYLTSSALTPPSQAEVQFTSQVNLACLGEEVSFYDQSTCSPNSYTDTSYDDVSFLWTFDNNVDEPYTSTDQNPTIIFNNAGIYDVTLSITNAHGASSLTKAESIAVSAGMVSACVISSFNNDQDYGLGVTNVSFNTINKETYTFIPKTAMQDFTCSDNTTIHLGSSYDLVVTYRSRDSGAQHTEVWIDWDNNGTFDTSNSHGINERVLTHDIGVNSIGSPSVSITPPATAVLNTLLRMRVISEYTKAPLVCGDGLAQRADDYGVMVANTLSVSEFTSPKFRMYPNPTKDVLTFHLENNGQIKGYKVYDISGKKVINIAKTDKNSIEVSGLPKGFYFVKVETDTAELVGKFIKE